MNDESPQYWTGTPMVETCDTTDFFEQGKVYREKAQNKPQLHDDLKCQFWCMAVYVHPSTRAVYAHGVFRSSANRPWNPYPVNLLLGNWTEGWDEIPVPEVTS